MRAWVPLRECEYCLILLKARVLMIKDKANVLGLDVLFQYLDGSFHLLLGYKATPLC